MARPPANFPFLPFKDIGLNARKLWSRLRFGL